ncbi:MAG: Flagellar FliJ protein [Gemmataceae bacterium]|nr:Flagellar FliJ protein [Gemmataceae bacterium]
MKRFEFPLDRLLKLKRQLEQIAELEQGRAQEAVGRARAALQEHHDQLTRVAEHITASVGRAVAPHQWTAAAAESDRIGHAIRAAEQEVAAAEHQLVAAAQKRAQLATEVEALSTLRRQQWEQWRQEAQKADQQRLDELGLRRWQAARDEMVGPAEPS